MIARKQTINSAAYFLVDDLLLVVTLLVATIFLEHTLESCDMTILVSFLLIGPLPTLLLLLLRPYFKQR